MLFYIENLRRELKIRNYSPKTLKAYELALRKYLKFVNWEILGQVEEMVKDFLLYEKEHNIAPKTLNVYLSAVKFFYRHVVEVPCELDIKFSKTRRRLPVVMSNEEIMAIIRTLANFKHRLIISLAYGAGLRVSEVANLRCGDLDFVQGTIFISNSKNGSDRYTLLPDRLGSELKEYSLGRDHYDLLFLSNRGGKMSTRTLQKIFKIAAKKVGASPFATFHSLRHSFASELLGAGVNLRYIQQLLGHRNIRTTEIYTHIDHAKFLAKIKSPF